jgi:hypothetical protein
MLLKSLAALLSLALASSALPPAPPSPSPRTALVYAHTWRRSAAAIDAQLANATAALAAGAIGAVALESFCLLPNLTVGEFAPGSSAGPSLADSFARVRAAGGAPWGWLLATAGTEPPFDCAAAARLTAEPAATAFVASLVQAVARYAEVGAAGGGSRKSSSSSSSSRNRGLAGVDVDLPSTSQSSSAIPNRGLAGVVVDLEPAGGATDPNCTAALGRAYAALLSRARRALAPSGVALRVYACAWQYHGVNTFFDYDADGAAAGRVVEGLTYDGSGNHSGAAALALWSARLAWLLEGGGAGACGGGADDRQRAVGGRRAPAAGGAGGGRRAGGARVH